MTAGGRFLGASVAEEAAVPIAFLDIRRGGTIVEICGVWGP